MNNSVERRELPDHTFSHTGPSIDDRVISGFEAEIGFTLSQDYRLFLLDHNGGLLGSDDDDYGFEFIHPVDGTKIITSGQFYGLNMPSATEDVRSTRDVFAGRIPNNLLAIGTDFSGDQICLGLSGEILGQIHIWLHDYEGAPLADNDLPTNVGFIASSFQEFIEKHEKV